MRIQKSTYLTIDSYFSQTDFESNPCNIPVQIPKKCSCIRWVCIRSSGLQWTAQDNNAFGYEVQYESGAVWTMKERERPHLLFDTETGEPTHLYNGVSPFLPYSHINDHSFTQVVPLKTSRSPET